MKIEPRYIFNANAFALGGRLTEPYVSDFTVQAPTTLPAVGGVAKAEARRKSWQELISFDSARSMVRGGGPPPYERVTTATSELTNLEVEGRFRIRYLRMTLRSYHEEDRHYPHIVPDETEITGVTIDGCKLNVDLDPCPFRDKPTMQDILQADGDWCGEFGRHFLKVDEPESGEPRSGGNVQSGQHDRQQHRIQRTGSGLVLATLVRSITPGCGGKCSRHGGDIDINGNVVTVPNFGRIYFGEVIIADTYRRMNAFRLKLGSPARGDLEGGGVGSNGGGVP